MNHRLTLLLTALVTAITLSPLQAFDCAEMIECIDHLPPEWAQEQIYHDLKEFRSLGISQEALQVMTESYPKHMDQPGWELKMIRYRIIDNQIYRDKQNPCYLEYPLLQLAQIVQMPNVDFVVYEADGAPESYVPRDFWIADDILKQAPLFTRCKKEWARYIVVAPDYSSFAVEGLINHILEANAAHPWESKTKKAFWRGSPSDFHMNQIDILSKNQVEMVYGRRPRFLISKLANQYPNEVDAGLVSSFGHAPFLGAFLERENVMRPERSIPDHIEYAYLPALSGWMSTYPGLLWRLLSNSVTFLQEWDDVLWFSHALKPYEHYIPLDYDCGNLIDQIEWARANDETCQKIAQIASEFVLNNLRGEHNYAYLFHLLAAYASLQKFDCRELTGESEGGWIHVGGATAEAAAELHQAPNLDYFKPWPRRSGRPTEGG